MRSYDRGVVWIVPNTVSARYYDPAAGRFISPDPLLDLRRPQWANAYSYAGGNPIGLSDPTGLGIDPDDCKRGGRADHCRTQRDRDNCYKRHGKKACEDLWTAQHNYSNAKTEEDRQFQALLDALAALVQIAAKELGIDAGIECLTTGNLAACGETVVNIIGTFAGGIATKLVAKYGLPWKWKKLGELAGSIATQVNKAKDAFTGWMAAKKSVQAAGNALNAAKRKGCFSSFVPGTLVLMADGTRKPIEQVKVGDKVIATDPRTGKTAAKPVTILIGSQGEKQLVTLTVGTFTGPGTATVTATAEHPFWAADHRRWLDAEDLLPGMTLRSPDGRTVTLTRVTTTQVPEQQVHNLTVADTHTYHVALGDSDILVHNSEPGGCAFGVGGRASNAPSKRNIDGGVFASRDEAVAAADKKVKEFPRGWVRFRSECSPTRCHVHVDVYNKKGQIIETWHYAYHKPKG
ncbi:polymorphic toxin-type HINT domain-containing protein [Rhizohabitans arisaemae]|uniref:polymorphic toxin-type HINT domain-containing protein n=1 Tax=Rhizohabitans arisaemae TaxID=2720610 RepID=UPI0024B2431C|nr:polymorphic toxin-type HINT domain-containing protein [Rhizohabitans arisaemae]